MHTTGKIVVVGSANMDMVIGVERLPREGETITGTDLRLFPGGKGANQACCAGRLGRRVSMIGQVGDDAFGSALIDSLSAANVDVAGIGRSNRPTGCASIYVMPDGENSIVISPGANATLDPETAVQRLDVGEGDIVLCQLETPLDTVEAVLAHAKARGAVTILDPAPARMLPAQVLRKIDFVTPNQTEAGVLLDDRDLEIDGFDRARDAAARLIQLGPSAVVMKLGEIGALVWDGRHSVEAGAFRVQAVDTTAAGDAFNGAFAVALAEGKQIGDALLFANAVAGISVTRPGAQPSMPTRSEVDEFLSAAGQAAQND
jgi:ribokinase